MRSSTIATTADIVAITSAFADGTTRDCRRRGVTLRTGIAHRSVSSIDDDSCGGGDDGSSGSGGGGDACSRGSGGRRG